MRRSGEEPEYRHSTASRKAEVEMGGAQSSENRWCGIGDPAQVNAALFSPQRGGQTTYNESLGAAGNKRPKTGWMVDFGTSYKRPMSSSGLPIPII
ncbi:jg7030 [Pararge aegeria aegeria]|uniref:Jg7030 protein n=1 Tax=Pararge aegeria aegeria TaxID=348720 RepID=A0A8S4RGA8_9NEOP|nr:jg7030 [Pararge aegeria aegeria]